MKKRFLSVNIVLGITIISLGMCLNVSNVRAQSNINSGDMVPFHNIIHTPDTIKLGPADAMVVDNPGGNSTGRYLPENTSWACSDVVLSNDGNYYFKVSSSEWIAGYFVAYGHYKEALSLKTNKKAQIYYDNGLPIKGVYADLGTTWKADRIVTTEFKNPVGEPQMIYRIAENQYLSANDVQ